MLVFFDIFKDENLTLSGRANIKVMFASGHAVFIENIETIFSLAYNTSIHISENLMVGIVLAGGSSTRAKVNKLLLEVDRKPLICHTINTISPFVDKVIVVTGKFHNELSKVITDCEIVFNSKHELGMFSSVLVGISHALGNDVLLIPGDITNVSANTIKAIIGGTKPIRIPSFNGKTGHPVLVAKEYVDKLSKEPVDSKLCDFIAKHNDNVEKIEVDDSYINFDIDTLDDYNKLRKEISL